MESGAFHDLLEHFPVGLSVVDQHGYLRYANRRVATLFGFPPELLRPGTDFREILRMQVARGDLHGDDPEALIERAMCIVLMTTAGAEFVQHSLANGLTLEMHRRRLKDGRVVCVYQDVSDRVRAGVALAQEQTLLRSTLDLMPCGIAVLDSELRFELFNQQVRTLFQFPPTLPQEATRLEEALRFQAQRGDFGSGDPEAHIRAILAEIPQQASATVSRRTLLSIDRTIEIRRRRLANGRLICIYIDITDSTRVAGELRMAKAKLEETVQRLAQANQELAHQARTDALTGVWNRRYFMERALEEVARYHRQPHAVLGVILLDVDHFKRVNDRFGHATGDRVLVELVKALGSVLRTQDLFCRVGGEEFALLLPGTDREGARQLAERLRVVAHQVRLEDQGVVTVSLGVTTLRPSDRTIDPALSRADQALYRAKHGGRDRVMVDETGDDE